MTLVLALDLATVAGWAMGEPGAPAPDCGSIRFASKGASHPAIFGAAVHWFIEFTRTRHPDVIAIEGALPIAAIARSKGGWGRAQNVATNKLLTGLIAIIEGIAFNRGIYQINEHQVSQVRSHFLGSNTHARDEAKFYVERKCRSLGWLPNDNNAADACALWSYQCSLLDPRQAIRVSPLFNRAVAI